MPELVLRSPDLTWAQVPQPHTLKLGVLASGKGSNLEALCAAIAAGSLNATVSVLVYNNPNAKAAERARARDIATELCNHRNYTNREAFDRAVLEILQRYQVEWVVMAGWMRIVTSTLINAYRDRTINIHPSLLPSFKGANAIAQALDAKVTITGCTAHLVRLEVDSGPILAQAAVPVRADDTLESLHARIQTQEHQILPLAIALAAQRERSTKG